MTSVKPPTSRNPLPRRFGPGNRRGALLKSTTPRRFWSNNRRGVLIFLKKNYKFLNL